MKKLYISPAETALEANLELPLAASKPPVYSGELGSRYHYDEWEEDDVEEEEEEDEDRVKGIWSE